LKELIDEIFNVTPSSFEKVALKVFAHQYQNCEIYGAYCNLIGKTKVNVTSLSSIPFLPISFFKTHKVKDSSTFDTVFTSSGTTGNQTSKHFITDLKIYEKSFISTFETFYGTINQYTYFALLPSYLEREGSSLIYMVNYLIQNGNPSSGFYLNNQDELITNLKHSISMGEKVILFGVSFALLDLAEQFNFDFSTITIIETGGMKGRKKEMIRSELHQILTKQLNCQNIHSEYGMTELLSQAYSLGNERFNCPSRMRVLIRSLNDPFEYEKEGKIGGVNVIDLANIHSCSFIETQDLGKSFKNGQFEILGRFDLSDVRGCNLLI
jgi:hypothetical protein